MQESQISFKERLSFGLAGLGQNMVYNYTTAYIMVFYTDVVKLLPVAVGTLMLIARVFDAVNDPIMGTIIDKTHTKKGKLIPYLKVIPVPMAVFTLLVFFVPDMSYTMRLVYAYVSFILWDLMYTVSDVPYWGLSVAITSDPNERLKLISLARILCNVGLAISIVIPPLMISYFGGGSFAYFITAVAMALSGSLLFSLVGYNAKERTTLDKQESAPIRVLFKNKPLMLLQLSRFLQAFRMVIATAGLYFAKYNMNDEAAFSILGGLLIAAMILAMLVTPLLKKIFSKKQLYNYSLLLGFASHFLMFILGFENMMINYILLFVSGLSLGLNDVITYTLVGDCVDYCEYQTGLRTEGLSFSLHTFTTKLQSAFGLFWIGIILTQVGFVENAVQSSQTLNGIFSLISLYPAVASLCAIIPMFWFKFSESDHEMMLNQMNRK
jgi:GPH family glycoside/pentoside/hexuronide:cation symporter/probable glucitol transport protein GutA